MIKKEELARICPTELVDGVLRAEPVQGVKIGYTSKLWGNGRDHAGFEDAGVTEFFRQPQRHTALVVEATFPPPALEGFDGSFTGQAGVQLNGLFADCLPLYMGTKDGKWIGFAHSGWQGSLAGIARNLVEKLTEASAQNPSDLWCVLGAYRGGEYYEVGEDFRGQFELSWQTPWLESCFETQNGKLKFDNGLFNLFLLKDLGVQDLSFMPFEMGTDERFYSHRRGEDGRNLGFIWREEI